jgi:hypothetical protein
MIVGEILPDFNHDYRPFAHDVRFVAGLGERCDLSLNWSDGWLRRADRSISAKATSDFSMDFLYFPTQEMARFAPFCRSVDSHLYGQWIHRIGRVVVEVSPRRTPNKIVR